MKGKDVRELLPELRRRIDRDYQRADLARDSGVSESHISRLESGERGLSEAIAKRLAPALGLAPMELYALAGFEAVDPAAVAAPDPAKARLRLRRVLIELGLSPGDRRYVTELAERLASEAQPSDTGSQ
jgi:transcriptional regulator with XRE-family HTH domain